MALIFCDSFDHYATGDILEKWDGATDSWSIASGGRFGTNRYASNDQSSKYIYKDLPAQDTYIFGFAYAWGSVGDGYPFMHMNEAASGVHLRLHINTSTNVLWLERGTSGVHLGDGTTVLTGGTYYYVELKVKVHDTTGTAELRVNGNVEFALTGLDTRVGGTGVIDRVYFTGMGGFGNGVYSMDDLYICDTVDSGVSGCPNDDFLGDVRVQALLPSGNGNSSDFLGSDSNSTDNYLLVDESVPNDDTDYVEDDVVGDKDTYAYSDLTATAGTVYGVQVLPNAKKTDAGARSIASVARVSATEEDSADKALTTSYKYLPDIREAQPNGDQWTISDVNSAEFGVKVTV